MSFELIPPEIMCEIFAYLPPKDLTLAGAVCHYWKDTLQDTGVDTSGGEAIWKASYLSHFGGPRKSNQKWKQVAQACEKQWRTMVNEPERAFKWCVASGHYQCLARIVEKTGWKGEQLDSFPSEKKGSTTPIHLAAVGGHGKIIDILLKNGANPSPVNAKKETPLKVACAKGHLEVLDVLLKYVGDALQGLPDAQELLHRAAAGGYVNLTEKLIPLNDGNADVADNTGKTPLHKACMFGRLKVIKLLVEKYNADINAKDAQEATPLFHAVSHGTLDIIEYLLEKGAQVTSNQMGTTKTTLFHMACKSAKAEIINILIEHGMDPLAKNKKAKTALFEMYFSLKIVKLILACVPPPVLPKLINDPANTLTSTTLSEAIDALVALLQREEKALRAKLRNGEQIGRIELNGEKAELWEIIELLLAAGADPNLTAGRPALFCIRGGYEDEESDVDLYPVPGTGEIECQLIDLLLKHGASINITDTDGRNVLWPAAERGIFNIVEKCIALGADPKHLDNSGGTPLGSIEGESDRMFKVAEYLLEKGTDINAGHPVLGAVRQPKYLKFLVEHGADPHIVDSSGWSLLHNVLEWPRGYRTCRQSLEYILTLGLDINRQNTTEGKTPLHIACLYSYELYFKETPDEPGVTHEEYHKRIVQLLLSHGADVSIKEWTADKTALDLAMENDRLHLVDILTEKLKDKETDKDKTEKEEDKEDKDKEKEKEKEGTEKEN